MSFIYLQRVIIVGVIGSMLALSACSDTSKEEDNQEQVQALLESKKAAEAAAEKASSVSPDSSSGTVIANAGEDAGMNLPGNCDASLAQGVVGQILTEQMGQQARQDTHSNKLRVLKPDDSMSMEFDTGRLTIEIDEKSVVINIRCG